MGCASCEASRSAQPGPRTSIVLLTTGASWLGMYLHNTISLPGQTALSPDTLLPTLVYLCLVGAWFTRQRDAALVGLCAWGWLHLIGGAVLSVAPWFNQPLEHVAAHLLYGVLALPLVLLTTPAARSRLGPAVGDDITD
jgi:hypothetical protein